LLFSYYKERREMHRRWTREREREREIGDFYGIWSVVSRTQTEVWCWSSGHNAQGSGGKDGRRNC
jgi:hypothetical protein